MTLSNVKYIKNIESFLIKNITKIHYEYEEEKPHKHSMFDQMKYLKNLKLNERLLSIVSDVIYRITIQIIVDVLV